MIHNILCLEVRGPNSFHKSLGDQLMNRLSRVVVIVPHAACPITVLARRISCPICCGVINDRPKRRRGIEDGAGDTTIR